MILCHDHRCRRTSSCTRAHPPKSIRLQYSQAAAHRKDRQRPVFSAGIAVGGWNPPYLCSPMRRSWCAVRPFIASHGRHASGKKLPRLGHIRRSNLTSLPRTH